MRLRRTPLWLALAFALTATPAYAVPLSPTPNPLPGGTFQAADGDQVAPAGLTDWAPEDAAGRVAHAADPNADDSVFTAGSKENLPGEWDLTTETGGATPAKANIRDAWGTVQQPSDRNFLNLAFARESGQGSAFLTFELNRAARLWDNGRARIPCRTTGDLLVSYEPQGNTVAVVVRRWVTTRADAGSGCAAEGRLEDADTITPNVDVQGAMNAAAIANALPGAYGSSIPEARFGEAGLDLAAVLADGFRDRCFAFTSVWMHSRSSDSDSAALQDYVGPERLDSRRCAASGTKFFDRNANGVRDSGEPGLARFVIFADYDGDGVHDASEPFAVTDADGRYVIDDIRPPGGTYTLRETLLPGRSGARGWRCSFPGAVAPGRLGCGHGPIDVDAEPYARGRDFGNWYPARLRVVKRVYPSDDPGRFDLLVNGGVVVAAAGDGGARTLRVRPGSYGVSERAVPPTDPAGYRSTVECKRGTRRTVRQAGTASSIALLAGDVGVCTFRNARLTAPVITIDKTGPATAEAGSTLRYTLFVENIGAVSIRAANVDVTDAGCDERPELDTKSGDPSPGTLDPGDVWVYTCSRATQAPGAACVARAVTNTGAVSGTANGTTVTDSSTISTVLTCPEEPESQPGGEVAPPGPDVPSAGVAGEIALSNLRGCLRRGSRVIFRVSRVRSLRLFVGGEPLRGVSVRPLQQRVVVRVRQDFAPGRYRVTALIRFQRGAGTAPVRIARTVRVCGRPPPVACPSAEWASAAKRCTPLSSLVE